MLLLAYEQKLAVGAVKATNRTPFHNLPSAVKYEVKTRWFGDCQMPLYALSDKLAGVATDTRVKVREYILISSASALHQPNFLHICAGICCRQLSVAVAMKSQRSVRIVWLSS